MMMPSRLIYHSPGGDAVGFYLITDAAPVVGGLQQLFAADWMPDHFADRYPFTLEHEKYGGPPLDFVFPEVPHYPVTEMPFTEALTIRDSGAFPVGKCSRVCRSTR